MSRQNTSPAYEKWVQRTSWPLLGAALVFFAAYALPILHLGLDDWVATLCRAVVWITWAAFAVDYTVRLVLVPKKWMFVRRHWLDLVFIIIPVLRPLALLRLVTVFLVIDRHAGARLRERIGIYIAGGTVLLVFAAAVAVLDVERTAPGANITSFGDAIWWACATITTVGYGDVYPVTVLGRVIAVGLMIGGISLLGIVTASFASWFVEIVSKPAKAPRASRSELEELRAEVARLRSELGERRPTS
ncbi:ion transporter [Amnibacterium flavum]|uniref:Ion transporter n=1 Tax=Amnibacterium flavum TaxID=2173173 RepID=A0A2V1HT74_9MICO|nr:ion transporter [Amnibacterium flavum]